MRTLRTPTSSAGLGSTLLCAALSLPLVFSLLGCGEPSSPVLPEAPRQAQEELSNLQRLLAETRETGAGEYENRFILWEQIIRLYQKHGRPEELQTLLGEYIQAHPKDPFNTYYLYIMARQCKEQGKTRAAVQYLEILLKNHPDLKYQDESIHYLALKQLIQLREDPYRRLACYQRIYGRFSGELEPGSYRYHLAKTYEEIGEWEKAVQEYRRFLEYPNAVIQGKPKAREEVQDLITFYDSDKSWVREDLNSLINSIKYAVRTMNAPLLRRYQSQVDFFLLSWNHTESPSALAGNNFSIRSFLKPGIRFAPSLDTDSNEQEAYLRSTGWYFNTPWYFYFRKVDFPADPEINGRWEWAGIYFGEKM